MSDRVKPEGVAPRTRAAQAWIELNAEDPEAASALWVARHRLAAGREITGLRRLRLIELEGALPTRPRLEKLLHESTQFYNPHKERCHVRLRVRDAAPVGDGEHLVLVTERGGERRAAAERWWQHETGRPVTVREGVVWALTFATPDATAVGERVRDLAVVRDRQHGLLCNPHCQDVRIEAGMPPVPWIGAAGRASRARRKPEEEVR